MKTKALPYLIWILVISNMFYSEYLGLNTLLTSLLSVGLVAALKPNLLRSFKWWTATGIWLTASLSVFLNGDALQTILFIISFFFFFGVSSNIKLSVPLGIMQSIQSAALGLYYYFDDIAKKIIQSEKKKNNRLLVASVLVVGSILVLFIFLRLYQVADPTFEEYTKWINLDWISWGFIGFYILCSILLYGLYYFRNEPTLDEWEDVLKNDIQPTHTDRVQRFFGTKNEFRTALGLLIPLNLMLLLYNFIDLRYVFTELHSPERTATYSEMVHDGVNALIFSIVLVILLLTFLFRGRLNFTQNKTNKFLAILWLVQNLIMVTTTSAKNYEYITHWGLTYKRIGVYIWLGLAVIGIILTIIKLLKAQSFWFLFRNGSLSFVFCFAILLCPNWNKIIADFNTTQIEPEKVDVPYLMDLGPQAYPAIARFHVETGMVDKEILYELQYRCEEYVEEFEEREEKSSWRSIVANNTNLYNDLNKIHFNFDNMYQEYRW